MNINLTLIGQTISFALFVWICMRHIWPPLSEVLSERTKKIADGLAAAREGELAKEQAGEEVQKLLSEARGDIAERMDTATKRADSLVDEAKQEAAAELAKVNERAAKDLDQQSQAVFEQLRSQVATLSVLGASAILREELDEAKHQKLIAKIIDEL